MKGAAGNGQQAAGGRAHCRLPAACCLLPDSALPGALALFLIAAFAGSSLVALATVGGSEPGAMPAAYLWQVARFTALEASLSALISCGLAVPVALALARRPRLPGRSLVLDLFLLPLALPQLVAVLGIAVVLGENGWLNRSLEVLGVPRHGSIYGLTGILIAHVFFNLPLAVRLLLAALERVPGESWRLAAELGLDGRAIWRVIERPIILETLPGIAGLVLMLCATSFTVVLTLGGGPAASTIEVAIYQALRFDFDPALALRLALLQLALAAGVLLLLGLIGRRPDLDAGLGNRTARPDLATGIDGDAILILAAAGFVALPILAVIAAGMASPLWRLLGEALLWRALATSLAIGAAAGLLAVMLAWPLIASAIRLASRARSRSASLLATAFELAAGATILLPPALLGAGLFLLLHRTGMLARAAPVVVVAASALFALPFVARVLAPALRAHIAATDRLATSLGIAGFDRLRLVDLPALRRPLVLAGLMGLLVSLGDLGVVALFGGEQLMTLPYLLLQRMGSYRSGDAAGLALVLLMLTLAISWSLARASREAGR